MDWGKWFDGLWKNVVLAGVPVLVAALETVREDPQAGAVAGTAAAAVVVVLMRMSNWIKHKDEPTPARSKK